MVVFAVVVLAAPLALAATPKNVILFIGDGMSTPQRMTAEEFAIKDGREKLYINHLPQQATTRTCSASSLVTDSAAAATAIACGTKTRNHAVGVDPAGKRLVSCAEVAKAKGRKVGIVTTVTINHATPAGFYAHRGDRNDGYGIGLDLLASGFDFFAGGGCDRHDDKGHKEYKGDIYSLAEKSGYAFAKQDRKAFDALKPGAKAWYVAASGTLPYTIDEDDWKDVPTLAELTAKAIKMLENPKGFFLMVEAGKIDYAGHANDAAANLREVLALDDAVKVALKYHKKHPETLVIVTGDHETGGMTMGFAGTGYNFYMDRLAAQKRSAEALGNHISSKKPQSFAEIRDFVTENYGLSGKELDGVERAFGGDIVSAVKRAVSAKCGIGWTSNSHTALPVLTTSIGPGSEQFTGFIDNTDISKTIKSFFR